MEWRSRDNVLLLLDCRRRQQLVLTGLLLDAGAGPDDGASLYHSLENLECTRLLLEHGAGIDGTNALYRALDLEDAGALQLLLDSGGNANEPVRNPALTGWGSPLLWAIRRRRSRRHVAALLDAGANAMATTPAGATAYKAVLQLGLADVAELLDQYGGGGPMSEDELFVAACASADEVGARRIQARRPDLPHALSAAQLRLLPDITAEGGADAAMLMVALGWAVAVRGGDWDASALNLAVFQGDATLTRFLLQHGARWAEEQAMETMSAAHYPGRRAMRRSKAVIGPGAPGRCLTMGCRRQHRTTGIPSPF